MTKSLLLCASLAIASCANTIAFIGDSHFAGKILPNTVAEQLKSQANIFAKNGRKASEIKNDAAVRMKNRTKDSDQYMIMFGANELAIDVKPVDYATDIRRVLNLIDNRKRIYVLVPFLKRNDATANEYAKILKQVIAQDKPNVKIIDTRLCDIEYSRDNVHLTANGYKKLGLCVASLVKTPSY